MRRVSTVQWVAATAWSLAAALTVLLLWQPKWWHPDCALREDGPIAYMAGFPLPFSEPSIVTSLEWNVAPGLLALNILLIVAVLTPLVAIAQRRLAAGSPLAANISASLGVTVALLTIAVWVLVFAAGWFRPTAAIGDYTGATRPWNVMPAVLAESIGKPACTR